TARPVSTARTTPSLAGSDMPGSGGFRDEHAGTPGQRQAQQLRMQQVLAVLALAADDDGDRLEILRLDPHPRIVRYGRGGCQSDAGERDVTQPYRERRAAIESLHDRQIGARAAGRTAAAEEFLCLGARRGRL